MVVKLGCTKTERQEVKENITKIVQLIKFYGLEEFNIEPTVQHWENLISHMDVESIQDPSGETSHKSRTITLTKYKLAAYIAYHAQDAQNEMNLPPCPFPDNLDQPHILIGGRFYSFTTKLILNNATNEKLSFLQTLTQSKGALIRPDEDYVRFAEVSTYNKLTGEQRKYTDAEKTTVGEIQEELRRTTREIFKGHKYTNQTKFAFGVPSSSANYNNSRKLYGALGHLLKFTDPELIGKSLISFQEMKPDEKDDDRMETDDQQKKYEVDVTKLSKAVYEFRKQVFKEALQEKPYAIPFGLSEPNKPRVITKGPPATYYILKPLQKFMFNIMKQIPLFELMGKPVNSQSILEVTSDIQGREKPLSGDYSDATNKLESWVTDTITDEVCSVFNLDNDDKLLINKALTQHILELRDQSGRIVIEEKPQTNGQLMGSILSFIWLCIANGTLVRLTAEASRETEILIKDIKAKVNGDDCLFNTDGKGKLVWEYHGRLMGLEPSIGKVFYTNKFVTLNSRMFHLNGEEIRFIPAGLLYGFEKSVRLGTSKKRHHLEGVEDIGIRNYWLMQASPKRMRKDIQTSFIKNQSKLLYDPLLEGIDWFMPSWSGGLGMCDVSETGEILNPIYPNIIDNPIPTYDDDMNPSGNYKRFLDECNDPTRHTKSRQALFHMLMNWNKDKFRPKPWAAMKYMQNLDIHKYITTKLPTKPTTKVVYGSEREKDNIYDSIFGLIAMEAYLTDPTIRRKISGNTLGVIDIDVRNNLYIDGDKIREIDTDKVIFDMEGRKPKEVKKELNKVAEKYMKDLYEQEFIQRIKYNSKIWKNNIEKGCTTEANWKFLNNRSYQDLFFGRVVGKGCSVIQELLDLDDPDLNPIEGFEFDQTQPVDF